MVVPTPFEAHSPEARAIASLFTLLVCGATFVIVTALVAWCVLRDRARPGLHSR